MLRALGLWWSREESYLPDPRDFVDADWPTVERRALVERLRGGFTPWVAAGFSHCRLCGRPCGSAERTDGVHLWPEGLVHYVSAHAVRIDVELVSFAGPAPEHRELDLEWWKAQRPARSTGHWPRFAVVRDRDRARRGERATDPGLLPVMRALRERGEYVLEDDVDAERRANEIANALASMGTRVERRRVPVPSALFTRVERQPK